MIASILLRERTPVLKQGVYEPDPFAPPKSAVTHPNTPESAEDQKNRPSPRAKPGGSSPLVLGFQGETDFCRARPVQGSIYSESAETAKHIFVSKNALCRHLANLPPLAYTFKSPQDPLGVA